MLKTLVIECLILGFREERFRFVAAVKTAELNITHL
jgi:hypothetical protein